MGKIRYLIVATVVYLFWVIKDVTTVGYNMNIMIQSSFIYNVQFKLIIFASTCPLLKGLKKEGQ